MPIQKAKSALAAKYGSKLDTAVKKHSEDPVDYGQMDLPPGIRNGIAKLTECYFDVYKTGTNKGEYYFRAAGVVLEPTSITGAKGEEIPVAGLQTSYIEAACDTKNTKGKVTSQEEHITSILNEMKKLGGEEFVKGASGADLEDLAAQLTEAAPHFRFSTSQSAPTPEFPDPKVWQNWYGSKGLENYAAPDNSDAQVTDNSGGGDEPPTETTTDTPADGGDVDVEALVAQAMDGDTDAQTQLRQVALDAGIEESVVDGDSTWEEIGQLVIDANNTAAAPDEEPPAAEYVPEKGEAAHYAPIDGKTRKPVKKTIECEIIAVDKKSKTVTLKNLTDGKTKYEKVAWSALVVK